MPRTLAVLISMKYGVVSAARALKDSASERVTVSSVSRSPCPGASSDAVAQLVEDQLLQCTCAVPPTNGQKGNIQPPGSVASIRDRLACPPPLTLSKPRRSASASLIRRESPRRQWATQRPMSSVEPRTNRPSCALRQVCGNAGLEPFVGARRRRAHGSSCPRATGTRLSDLCCESRSSKAMAIEKNAWRMAPKALIGGFSGERYALIVAPGTARVSLAGNGSYYLFPASPHPPRTSVGVARWKIATTRIACAGLLGGKFLERHLPRTRHTRASSRSTRASMR